MFKIISKKVESAKWLILLLDGTREIESYLATSIQDRDNKIYQLSIDYSTVDIEHITLNSKTSMGNSTKKLKNSVNDIPVIPYTNLFQLEDYFDKNNEFIFNRIIEGISEGLENKKKKIKLFQINNSGEYVDALKRNWPAGLRIAHKYFLQEEQFDKCNECKRLLELMKCKL